MSLISIFPALRDEEAFRSPMMLDEESNDEKASIEMQLYGEDGDTVAENEILEDENALLGIRIDVVCKLFTIQL